MTDQEMERVNHEGNKQRGTVQCLMYFWPARGNTLKKIYCRFMHKNAAPAGLKSKNKDLKFFFHFAFAAKKGVIHEGGYTRGGYTGGITVF